MFTRNAASLIPIFCLALAACSDDDTGGGGGGGGGGSVVITNDNIVPELLRTYCQVFVNCSDEWGGTFDSVSECLSFFDDSGPDFNGVDDPNLYDIDSDLAKSCLATVASAPCDRELELDSIADCEAAVVGKLVQNDCCDERDGCAPGLFCDGSDATTTGTCQPRVAENGDCSSAQCEIGLYCNENFTCMQPKGQGVACLDLEDECAPLDCLGGFCQPDLLVGDTCDLADDQCPMAAMCLDTTGTPTCQPCPFCQSAGTSCDPQQSMAFGCLFAYILFADFYCEPDASPAGGTCQAMPGLGGNCEASLVCDPTFELYCHEDANSGDQDCRARLPNGSACDPTANDPCLLNSDCDQTTMTCLPEDPAPVTCP